MADFTKLVQHPDLQEIIQKLNTGISPKNISDWLKQKYPPPNNSHLYLTPKLLADFLKSNYMHFSAAVRSELEKVKNKDKLDNKLSKTLKENDTWQELLQKQAKLENKEIDLKQMMADTLIAINKRIQQVFDVIQQNPENIGNKEYAFIKWCETLFSAVKKYDDVINKKPENISQTNIYNIQIVQQHLTLFQDAIRNVISRFDPEISSEFITQLNIELCKLNQIKEPKQLTSDNKIEQLETLGQSIKELHQDAIT